MINLSHRFASELVEFAEENGLEAIYRQALRYAAPLGGGAGRGPRGPGRAAAAQGALGALAGSAGGGENQGGVAASGGGVGMAGNGGRPDAGMAGGDVRSSAGAGDGWGAAGSIGGAEAAGGRAGDRDGDGTGAVVGGGTGAVGGGGEPGGAGSGGGAGIGAGAAAGAGGSGAGAAAGEISPLDAFLANVPEGQRMAVIDQFLDLARSRLNLVDAEVISAAPLTAEQQHKLEIQLIRAFRKRVSIRLSVDPSLIGGLRVLANDMVFDDSVKRKLADMKSSIYKGVYFR